MMIFLKKVKTIWRPGFDELQEMAGLQPFQNSQGQIDESNAYQEEEHAKQVQAANELVLDVIGG